MHGLINRSLENFIRRKYGDAQWAAMMDDLDLGFDSFEPMFVYEDDITQQVIDAVSERLSKPRSVLLEDLGTFMVTDESAERVRRLLRFGGVDYEDFLHSLEDLPGRARLAVAELKLPDLELNDYGGGEFDLTILNGPVGFGHVLLGMLRALADDYGALALVDFVDQMQDSERLAIRLLDVGYQEGRQFDLAVGAGG